jgi:hypothetical protein
MNRRGLLKGVGWILLIIIVVGAWYFYTHPGVLSLDRFVTTCDEEPTHASCICTSGTKIAQTNLSTGAVTYTCFKRTGG